MIHLTRLNQVPLVVNADLIEHIEMTPDTVIALTTGQKILVRESADEIIEKVIRFRRNIVEGLPCSTVFASVTTHPPGLERTMGVMANEPTASRRRIDFATVVGIVVGTGGILGGLLLEGGKFTDIVQYTAALIVGAGTAGAVLVTTPSPLIGAALRRLKDVITDAATPRGALIAQLLHFARQARRSGIVSLEDAAEDISDNPFLKKALSLAVDGTDLQDLRRIMELEIEAAARRGEAEAKVFETAGGYAPTIGIIGAVLGLIQVMKHLEDIERVGHGIAVAFVATVYGVALANCVLLPAGAKIKARLERALENMELVLEGVIGIAEGMNPKLLETKLGAFLEEEDLSDKDEVPSKARAAARVRASGHGAI